MAFHSLMSKFCAASYPVAALGRRALVGTEPGAPKLHRHKFYVSAMLHKINQSVKACVKQLQALQNRFHVYFILFIALGWCHPSISNSCSLGQIR